MAQAFNTNAITPAFGTGLLMCKPVVQAGQVYTTGGMTYSASIFEMANVGFVLAEEQDSTGTYWVQVRQSAGPGSSTFTVQVFTVGGSTEVSNAVDLTGYYFRFLGYGN